MVELRLLAEEYHASNEYEQRDRDLIVSEMVLGLSQDYLDGALYDSVVLYVSFFTGSAWEWTMEALRCSGVLSLCRNESGCTRVLRIELVPSLTPLFTSRAR